MVKHGSAKKNRKRSLLQTPGKRFLFHSLPRFAISSASITRRIPMVRLLASLVALASFGAVFAQPPANAPALRFKWQAGQVQTYKVTQQTVIQETTLDEKTEKPVVGEARTNLTLTRKWTVKEVDAMGVAT